MFDMLLFLLRRALMPCHAVYAAARARVRQRARWCAMLLTFMRRRRVAYTQRRVLICYAFSSRLNAAAIILMLAACYHAMPLPLDAAGCRYYAR